MKLRIARKVSAGYETGYTVSTLRRAWLRLRTQQKTRERKMRRLTQKMIDTFAPAVTAAINAPVSGLTCMLAGMRR